MTRRGPNRKVRDPSSRSCLSLFMFLQKSGLRKSECLHRIPWLSTSEWPAQVKVGRAFPFCRSGRGDDRHVSLHASAKGKEHDNHQKMLHHSYYCCRTETFAKKDRCQDTHASMSSQSAGSFCQNGSHCIRPIHGSKILLSSPSGTPTLSESALYWHVLQQTQHLRPPEFSFSARGATSARVKLLISDCTQIPTIPKESSLLAIRSRHRRKDAGASAQVKSRPVFLKHGLRRVDIPNHKRAQTICSTGDSPLKL